jgi:hypothetical protein
MCIDFLLAEDTADDPNVLITHDRADFRAACLNYTIIFSYLVASTPKYLLEVHAEAILMCVSRYILIYRIESDAFLYLLASSLSVILAIGVDQLDMTVNFITSFVRRYSIIT